MSTARIAALVLPNARLRIGLSWRSLKAAAQSEEENGRWGVLYLGTAKKSADQLKTGDEVVILSPKGNLPYQGSLDGIVALDGNWSQAKALWWRNPWLLKLKRIVLAPKQRSLYGKLRREPRPESLSTLEALALTLAVMEKDEQIRTALLRPFEALLHKYRQDE